MSMEAPVVVDLGSESIKAGYAVHVPSEQEPRIVTPSLVTIKSRSTTTGQIVSRTERVTDKGYILNFDCLESMLHYLLYEQLGWIKGEEGSILFVEPLFTGKSERERLTKLMFEEFNVAGLYLHDAAVSSLFSTGKMAGCVVDIGHGKIDVAAVSEGITQAPGAARLSFAGEQLTELLGNLLQQQQLLPQQLGALKTQCCQAAPSPAAYQMILKQQQHVQHTGSISSTVHQQQPRQVGSSGIDHHHHQQSDGSLQEYTLPDGIKIAITTEGLTTAEALFDPTLLRQSTPGLVDCILEVVSDLPDASIKRSVLENLLLCGGGACIPGLGQRVISSLTGQLPTGLPASLCQLPEYMLQQSPQYVPYIGGAVMAKLVAYQSHFMIKAEYEEIGPSAVHRKCA
eukprot:gene9584-9747_t